MSRRKLVQSPKARRDIQQIIEWYRADMGARSALRVAQTIREALASIRSGDNLGAVLGPSELQVRRVLARQHVVIFHDDGETARVLRVVHGARDLDAVLAALSDD